MNGIEILRLRKFY